MYVCMYYCMYDVNMYDLYIQYICMYVYMVTLHRGALFL